MMRFRAVLVALSFVASSQSAAAQAGTLLPRGVEAGWLVARKRPVMNLDPARLPSRAEILSAIEYVFSAQIAVLANEPVPLSTAGALR